MAHDHAHALPAAGNERRLAAALALTTVFLAVEIVGGLVTNSLALLSDAAHMFTDVTALGIALAAIRIGRRPADERRSYGYRRLEILAAGFNALLLFAVAGYILYEASQRFREPPPVHSTGMLAIAAIGLVVNIAALKLLSGGRDESLNVKGAYLEVWSDLLGSVGVMVAAAGIAITGWRWLDPLVAVGIGLWVLPRTWKLLRESGHVLLEGTPAGIDMMALRKTIETTPGVRVVHDLHVWSVTSGRHILTAHVVTAGGADQAVLKALSGRIREGFGIGHTTIQLEAETCGDLDGACRPGDAKRTEDDGHAH